MQDDVTSTTGPEESPPSPRVVIKRAKLNDGSSRDTLTDVIDAVASYVELEPEGSEIVPDSSTNDVAMPGAADDSGGEDLSTSSDTLEEIVLKIKREAMTRNYGRRNVPDRDSGSPSSVSDSDDDAIPSTSRPIPIDSHENNTLMDVVESQRQFELSGSNSDDDDISEPQAGADDSTDEDIPWTRDLHYDLQGYEPDMPAVLLKDRPKHKYSMLKEVLNREIGMSVPRGKPRAFEDKFTSSLHAVLRLEKMHSLLKHNACINCMNFHPDGQLLVSGSDEANVIVWDWARNIPVQIVNTEHKANVQQTKFLYLNSSSQLNIVTCGRDGQVRLAQCSSAGGSWSRRRLAVHGKAANKLHVMPLEPHSVLSAGEDGFVFHYDLRVDTVNKLLQVKDRSMAIALYSLHGHPLDSNHFVLAGREKFVRIYDRRRITEPVAKYCPTFLVDETLINTTALRFSALHLTCAMYNHDGTEIVASYNDDDIYLFNLKNDVYFEGITCHQGKGFTTEFSGHRNSATLKSVTFYGSKSEYVISGSDCGYIYIWDTKTGAIVQWLSGDEHGMVNTVEVHPRLPILASGGLDKDVKIWAPYGHKDPTFKGMRNTIYNNTTPHWHSPLFSDFLPSFYRSWRGDNRMIVEEEELPYSRPIEATDSNNICLTF